MIKIRPYQPTDKDKLRYICKETAFSSYKREENKLETVPIIYNDYFTEYEPKNVFVAVDENDEPVGYVICTTNYEKFKKTMLGDIKNRVKRTKRVEIVQIYLILLLLKFMKPEYRTHLHIDILPEYQSQGIGTRLLKTLSEHLFNAGYGYMSVVGISKKSAGCKFYKKFGFFTIKTYGTGNLSMAYKTKKESL